MLRIVLLSLGAALLYAPAAQAHEGHGASCAYGNTHSGPFQHYHPGGYAPAVPWVAAVAVADIAVVMVAAIRIRRSLRQDIAAAMAVAADITKKRHPRRNIMAAVAAIAAAMGRRTSGRLRSADQPRPGLLQCRRPKNLLPERLDRPGRAMRALSRTLNSRHLNRPLSKLTRRKAGAFRCANRSGRRRSNGTAVARRHDGQHLS